MARAMAKKRPERATTDVPRAPRGAAVVVAVIRATFEELAEVGYAALGIDDVARRAGVNKTTVYRRWPTKEDLVSAALLGLPEDYFTMPDTGTLAGDLTELSCRMARIFQTVEGRALMRILFFEGRLTHLKGVHAHFEARRQATGLPALLRRSIARGEVPLGFDQQMLDEVLFGTIACKALIHRLPLDEAFVSRLVDIVLTGMLSVKTALSRDRGVQQEVAIPSRP